MISFAIQNEHDLERAQSFESFKPFKYPTTGRPPRESQLWLHSSGLVWLRDGNPPYDTERCRQEGS